MKNKKLRFKTCAILLILLHVNSIILAMLPSRIKQHARYAGTFALSSLRSHLLHHVLHKKSNDAKQCFTRINCGGQKRNYTEPHETSLRAALSDKDTEALRAIIIDLGVNVNIRYEALYTPLHWAVMEQCIEIVRLLILGGADVNAKDFCLGRTPLHCATDGQNKEIFKLLIEAGADVNMKDRYGNTLLYSLVDKQNEEIVDFLLKAGANPNTKDRSFYITLLCAIENQNEKLVGLLLEAGAHPNSERIETDDFMTYRVNPKNIIDKESYTPLRCAINAQNKGILKLLLKAGADVNMKDFYHGRTPLHYAIDKNDREVVDILIASGAHVNASDKYGNTPLSCAIDNQSENIAQALIQAGADNNK